MIKRIIIVLAMILAVVLGRGLFFYNGFYNAPPSEMPSYENIVVPAPPISAFSDNFTTGEGTVLIDLAHDNAFDIEELNVLISRLVARGLAIEFLSEDDNLEEALIGTEEEEEEEEDKDEAEAEGDQAEENPEADREEEEPEEEFPGADAFIVVSPREEFSREERKTIDKFVSNGGRLLLIADPTRRGKMNSLSLKFGLIFEADYLYNQKENETNFRNIFLSAFQENSITKNLKRIVLYTAGSITSDNASIAFVDRNTFSSVIATRKELSPIALTQEAKVLAVYDLTFITEPYNGVTDNNQLIANIADWLAHPAEELEEEEEEEGEEEEKTETKANEPD